MNPNILYEESIPFSGAKLQTLENFVSMMNSGDPSKMAQATEALETMRETTNFWLQTDTIIQQSQHTQTIFFGLMALHIGVKVI